MFKLAEETQNRRRAAGGTWCLWGHMLLCRKGEHPHALPSVQTACIASQCYKGTQNPKNVAVKALHLLDNHSNICLSHKLRLAHSYSI